MRQIFQVHALVHRSSDTIHDYLAPSIHACVTMRRLDPPLPPLGSTRPEHTEVDRENRPEAAVDPLRSLEITHIPVVNGTTALGLGLVLTFIGYPQT